MHFIQYVKHMFQIHNIKHYCFVCGDFAFVNIINHILQSSVPHIP